MKKLLILLLAVAAMGKLSAAVDGRVFGLLDLQRKGLETVKAAVEAGDTVKAADELLKYYRTRKPVILPGFDPAKVKLTDADRKMADEALEHKFFSHRGYQPSYFYGDDIDWRYWPVRDNELRWQLHRHKWFIPLLKAYKVTGDKKYILAWEDQYLDWLKKNPLDYALWGKPTKKVGAGDPGDGNFSGLSADAENMHFAWRPLETTARLQDQPFEFAMAVDSKYFTPEFLTTFLYFYHVHGNHVITHLSAQGNHLLFEAQRLIFGGTYFPEFKDASKWVDKGVNILNDEMKVQVLPDGMQYELDFGYHMASIEIFLKAMDITIANGIKDQFPASYLATIEKMIEVTYNTNFPDYTDPIFSDHKIPSKDVMVRNFAKWSKIFPDNQQIKWFATEGAKGKQPANLSKAFDASGFYVLRNGWDMQSTMMVLKAGPPGEWHNQPDNGTFELWRKGRNFFIDSGCYVYGGDAKVLEERAWFRQTKVHNTLTLDGRTYERPNSELLFWGKAGTADAVVVQTPSYPGLTHRRAVFFVDNEFFVIVDEATGDAQGDVALHYGLCPSAPQVDLKAMSAVTAFKDDNNVKLQVFCEKACTMTPEEGWTSPDYRKKEERPAYGFTAQKTDAQPMRFITVITPQTAAGKYAGAVSASFVNPKYNPEGAAVKVKIGKRSYQLEYKVQK